MLSERKQFVGILHTQNPHTRHTCTVYIYTYTHTSLPTRGAWHGTALTAVPSSSQGGLVSKEGDISADVVVSLLEMSDALHKGSYTLQARQHIIVFYHTVWYSSRVP